MPTVKINAEGLILGRMATHVAKLLLLGYEVEIYNAGKVILTGSKTAILERERARFARGSSINKGPYAMRTPEGYMKRVIRGMLPWKTTRGREAYKRLRVYTMPAPEDAERPEEARVERSSTLRHVTLQEILKALGV